jgi:hypothetical protein
MSFECTTIVNKPLKDTVAIYFNPTAFSKWQDGFQSYEHLSGESYHPGSKALFVYVNGKRRIELTETILTNNLPNELDVLYDHEHMSNKLRTRFQPLPDNQTKVTTEPYEIRFKGLLPKIFGPLMKGKMRQQSQQWLDNFKTFAETNHSPAPTATE